MSGQRRLKQERTINDDIDAVKYTFRHEEEHVALEGHEQNRENGSCSKNTPYPAVTSVRTKVTDKKIKKVDLVANAPTAAST